MDCPDCKTRIPSSHLIVNSLSCPSCSISLFKLAKHIHDHYPWVCYIIKQNNIVKYVGYTTDLLARIKSHIYSDIISRITNKHAKCSGKSLAEHNIEICVSLHLSERDLIKIFKPYYNLSEGISHTDARLMKGGKYIELDAPQYHTYNINSLLINNNINKQQNDIIHVANVGIISGIATPKYKFVYDSRSYCYRWRGNCQCEIPCKRTANTMILRSTIDKSYDVIAQLKAFKQDKLKERYQILKQITQMPDDILSGHLNSTFMMNQYMTEYIKMTDSTHISSLQKYKKQTTLDHIPITSGIDPIIASTNKAYVYNDKIVAMTDTMSPITLASYAANLRQVEKAYNAQYGKDAKYCGIPTLITKPSHVMSAITTQYKIGTVGTLLSAIIWRLRSAYQNKEANVTPVDIYMYMLEQKKIVDVRNAAQEELDGKLTEKEAKNFIPWETVLEARAAMEAKLNIDSFRDMTDFVIVALYTYNPPIRADYANMRVFVFDEDVPADYKDNYCVIDSPRPRFVLWKFKNATGTEAVTNPIHPTLHKILLKWLDLNTSEYLLASATVTGLVPMTENALSQRVRVIFERWTGRTASINTLRHAFISYNSRTDQHVRKKEENAKMMMHTPAMADQYRRYVYPSSDSK